MSILELLLTIQLVIYSLVLRVEIVKFNESLVAKILIFQLVHFDYFFKLKNDYLNSEKKLAEK